MYAIIRKGNKEYYTSAVFGFYDDNPNKSGFCKYYIVLNEEKNKLIKKKMFNPKKKPYYDLTVLLLNDCQHDWDIDADGYGCINFLNKDLVEEIVQGKNISDELIEKCKDIDSRYIYYEYNEIRTQKDVDNFMLVSGGFHDARILEVKELENDILKVIFDGLWGCNIEMVFEGKVSYCIDSRDPEEYDPYWFGSSIFFDNNMIVFVDDEDVEIEDINDNYCWFKAEKVTYHIIPE